MKNMKTVLTIKDILHETADTIIVYFAHPPVRWDYLPGQFMTLIIDIDGREEHRCYSLCSLPNFDEDLFIAVKRVKDGIMSNYLHDHARVGDDITVLPPAGNFRLGPADNAAHLVLIGCGSGISPLFPILKSALINDSTAKISLIYVSSNRENTIFYRALEQWVSDFPFRLQVVYYWGDEWKRVKEKVGFFTRLFSNKSSYAHRIDAARLQSIFHDRAVTTRTDTAFYICGPQKLMEMARATIEDIGFPKEAIHTESFLSSYAANDIKNISMQQRSLKIQLRGKQHQIDVPAGKSILFAGLEAGLDMPFSCQSGNCISCAGRCLSGEVGMLGGELLTKDQLNDGYVLTCVAYPKSDDVVIDFQ